MPMGADKKYLVSIRKTAAEMLYNAYKKGRFTMAQVNIRIDDNLKQEGDRLFNELGISFSSAVSIFVSQAIRERAIPFRITADKPVRITLASENLLAKEWLSPEEDSAWANL